MMRNTKERFGLVSILLHWITALAVFGLFGLGWYMVELTYYDALYKTLPHIHKSIGLLLLMLFVFRFAWKWANPAPDPVSGSKGWEINAARIAHWLMYLLLALIFTSGYLISTADGSAIDVFELFSVPATVTSIPEQEDIAGLVHEYLAYTLIGLVLLHASAALKHHFIDRDEIRAPIERHRLYRAKIILGAGRGDLFFAGQ